MQGPCIRVLFCELDFGSPMQAPCIASFFGGWLNDVKFKFLALMSCFGGSQARPLHRCCFSSSILGHACKVLAWVTLFGGVKCNVLALTSCFGVSLAGPLHWGVVL